MTYNSAYTGPQIDSAARLASIIFDDLPAMLADARDYTAHTAGDVFWTAAEGFRYRVAASDATNHHLTTAGGVNLDVLPSDDGRYNFRAFNPTADGTTDDYAVLMKALTSGVDTTLANQPGPTIHFPAGVYFIGQTVELRYRTTLIGEDVGYSGTRRTTLKFPAETTGFVVNAANTGGGTAVASGSISGPFNTAQGTVFRNLRITGTSFAGATVAHGIWMRASASIENCTIDYFTGNGAHIFAWVSGEAPGSPAQWGNANSWRVSRCSFQWNRGNGLHVQGSDVNGGMCENTDFTLNGRNGLYDNSFLGNTYIGCHAATNGVANSAGNAATQGGSVVGLDNIRYAAVYGATEAQLVATTPGTNSDIWRQIGTGGAFEWIAPWQASQPEGTYFVAAPYWLTNNNARTVMAGCYTESDGGGVIADGAFITITGGTIERFNRGSQLTARDGGKLRAKSLTTSGSIYGDALEVALSQDAANSDLVTLTKTGEGLPFRLRWPDADIRFDYGNLGAAVAFRITGPNTTYQFGTGAAVPYLFQLNTLGLGSGSNARRQTTGTAAPTTGAWARGDIVWNINAAAAGWAGWICVTAGAPGTWKRFGAIEA